MKYEDVYLRDYADGIQTRRGLGVYFTFYNTEREHQSLDHRTPRDVYTAGAA